MIESQHLYPSREEVLHNFHTGSVCFLTLLAIFIISLMRKTGKLLPEGQQHHRRQPQKRQCHPHYRHNLSSFHLMVKGWQRRKDDSHPRQPREHCQHLYQHFIKKFAKLAGIAAKVPLSKVPRASLCPPTPHPRWCDVGVKTVNSPPGINDVCFFFLFLLSTLSFSSPSASSLSCKSSASSSNPPPPPPPLHYLAAIKDNSEKMPVSRRPLFVSPGTSSDAARAREHTHSWHTLSSHTIEPRYESCRGELDQPEISLFHFDLQYDLVFALIVLALFCSQWIMLLNQLRFLTQIFRSSSSCHPRRPPFLYLAAVKGNSGEKVGTKFFVWTEGSNKELGFFSSPQS